MAVRKEIAINIIAETFEENNVDIEDILKKKLTALIKLNNIKRSVSKFVKLTKWSIVISLSMSQKCFSYEDVINNIYLIYPLDIYLRVSKKI